VPRPLPYTDTCTAAPHKYLLSELVNKLVTQCEMTEPAVTMRGKQSTEREQESSTEDPFQKPGPWEPVPDPELPRPAGLWFLTQPLCVNPDASVKWERLS
jgi:hypothetical protein